MKFNQMALTIICLFSLIANLVLVIYIYEKNERFSKEIRDSIEVHRLLVDTKLELMKADLHFGITNSVEELEKAEEQ